MRFKVTRQFAKGTETHFAQFADLNDAKLFIQAKLADDAALNVKVIYRIEEFTDVIMEFDPDKQGVTTPGGSQGKTSEANFRPSPLSTSARPPGMAQNWRTDEEDKKK
jgi:hypothetical protein